MAELTGNSPSAAVQFVNYHRDVLIQRVSSVMPIADVLRQKDMIENEAYNIHRTKTSQDQMRLLYETLEDGGQAVKAAFYSYLQVKHRYLVKDLNDTSGSSSSVTNPEASRTLNEPVFQDQESCKVGRITYNTKDVLGESENAVVYRGTYEKGPKDMVPVAVKKVTTKKFAQREIQMLRESDKQPRQHANIIRWFGTEEEGSFIYIALELCDTSLNKFLSTADEYPDRKTLLDLLYQIMSGLAHLHSLNIVHRDVKPENMLLRKSDDGKMTVKVSDFGISKKLDQKNTTTLKGLGTLCWMAPAHDCDDDLSLDIFPAGCLFHYVLTKTHPFGDMNKPRQVMANIECGKYSLDLMDNKHDNIVARDLIEQMLSMEPEKRPSAVSVLKHPFFWSSERTLDFFQDVSDWAGKKQMDKREEVIKKKLESEPWEVVKEGGWMKHICEHLKNQTKERYYEGDSIKSLIRVIRNTKHHYNEYAVEFQTSLGSIPDGFVYYFTSRFHKLLLHTYLAMRDCQDPTIQKYYVP